MFEGEYLLNAFAPDVLLANERTYEERLAACRMLVSADDPRPTVLGMLTIGLSPREWFPCDYIQFLRIRRLEWSDPIVDEAVIDGSLATLLRRIDDKLRAHLSTRVDISPDVEVRSAAYPLTALQQLIRNAVMHRTYEHTNTPVRVYGFDDRIEIHSPGGPFGIVNAANFGLPLSLAGVPIGTSECRIGVHRRSTSQTGSCSPLATCSCNTLSD